MAEKFENQEEDKSFVEKLEEQGDKSIHIGLRESRNFMIETHISGMLYYLKNLLGSPFQRTVIFLLNSCPICQSFLAYCQTHESQEEIYQL